jgi:hypothetical protein
MMVNTSVSNRNLKGVNNLFADDFIVFEDIENILQQGSYQKEDTWHF